MDSRLQRRDLLKQIGTVSAAGTLLTGMAGARDKSGPPSDNVETERVHPFSPRDDPVEVSAGSWINHKWGWINPGEDSSRDAIEEFFDSGEHTVIIDGEEVENLNQYWGEPYQNENDEWIVYWEYVTHPKPPGLYELTVETYFPDGYDAEPDPRPPGTRIEQTGYYKVTSGDQ